MVKLVFAPAKANPSAPFNGWYEYVLFEKVIVPFEVLIFWVAVNKPPLTILPFNPAGIVSAEKGARLETSKSTFVCM